MNIDEFHGIKLLTLCGGGAYGDVYYASDISGKKIAIKIKVAATIIANNLFFVV